MNAPVTPIHQNHGGKQVPAGITVRFYQDIESSGMIILFSDTECQEDKNCGVCDKNDCPPTGSGDRRTGPTGQSPLRQAQGDNCHGELVEPWIPRSSRGMTLPEKYLPINLSHTQNCGDLKPSGPIRKYGDVPKGS